MDNVAAMKTQLAAALARRRVPIGFVCGLVTLWLAQPTPRSLTVGGVVGACGEGLRIWAAGHLEKSREVTTSGPYRITRHPLYVGSTVMGIGLAIASSSLIVAGLVALYLGSTLTAAIRSEEAHLTEKFGRSYPDYRDGRGVTDARRFSLRRAFLNREYRALIGFLVVFGLLAVKLRA
jgi:hypothetical protein